jgi:putative tricarboxylic transport membrane protein
MAERIVALVMLVASAVYLVQAVRMPLGAAARPGPGFYPVGVGLFACAVAVVIVALAFRHSTIAGPSDEAEVAPDDRRRVWMTVATLAAFCLLLPWIGYPLAALLLVGALLLELGASWWRAVLAAVVSAEASYYVFGNLLGVALPQGPWFH